MSEITFLQKKELPRSTELNIAAKVEKLLIQTPKQLRARREGLLHRIGLTSSINYFPDVVIGRSDRDEDEDLPNIVKNQSFVGIERADGSPDLDSILGMVTVTWVTARIAAAAKSELRMTAEGYSIDAFSNSCEPEDSIASMCLKAAEHVSSFDPKAPIYVYEPQVPARAGFPKKTEQSDINTSLAALFGDPEYASPMHIHRIGAGVSNSSFATVYRTT